MPDDASEVIELLQKIHGLLELLAEDKIAQRDAKQRAVLRQIAGASLPKQKSMLLMDGTRTQVEIRQVTSFNQGHLSTLVKTLQQAELLTGDPKKPNLAITIPPNFFESNADAN
ncbi:succinyl-CoA synthetase alpha subunit [Devosia sp. UYZn731]|uniref:hypothetical protein n=1 Tax=Devosia sp. UYZn731 TaxID=3156345 RepID=UPI00339551CD